ncbi:MAG: helix-turn-helix domain-containing protein [Planctomycetota bacterium]
MPASRPWFGYWRAAKAPGVALPLGARSVGRARVTPGWTHGKGQIHWVNLYWGAEGEARFLVDDAVCVVRAGELTMHPPESRIDGIPNEGRGAYRWCTADGPLAFQVVRAFGIAPCEPVAAGPCPHDLFDALERDIRDVSAAAEMRASATLYRLLALAAERAAAAAPERALDPEVDAALRLLEEQHADPTLTVDRIARETGVHRSRLSRRFREQVGLPPSTYLQRLRLQKALTLLRDPALSIAEAAYASGFADPAYFSRCVRRDMRASPRELRRTLF